MFGDKRTKMWGLDFEKNKFSVKIGNVGMAKIKAFRTKFFVGKGVFSFEAWNQILTIFS